MKIYRAWRKECKAYVTVNCFPLDPRRELWNYLNEFEWGYDGRGPAQLALALLADCLDDDNKALLLHEDFKRIALVPLTDRSSWILTEKMVKSIVASLEVDR